MNTDHWILDRAAQRGFEYGLLMGQNTDTLPLDIDITPWIGLYIEYFTNPDVEDIYELFELAAVEGFRYAKEDL